jgi:transposase-like protein
MGTINHGDAFKRDAVQQITVRGYPVRGVSRHPGVRSHALYEWLGLFAAPASKASGIDHDAENRRLKRELARVTKQRDILIRQRRTSRAVPMEYAFLRAHQTEFRVRDMCRVLRVHFSGLYAWLKEPLSRRAKEDARQTGLVQQV